MIHELKCASGPFDAIDEGSKTFEFRKEDDRRFEVGDQLRLREFDRKTQTYSGWIAVVDVTYILRGPDFGVPEGYCVMSIRKMEKKP